MIFTKNGHGCLLFPLDTYYAKIIPSIIYQGLTYIHVLNTAMHVSTFTIHAR